ncbi:hypothetical protein SmJEL517_g03116 [Synchytrium microbalum]|uniref:MICOS complex subunit MIC60 n=1 Tax=Synchytrium microbalum TaxID=1806994 RepID=A0A507BXU6_9FUNG|nr:uncharacterized protein SmJEL517_g03116 [Synchytrium microbalum]TPX34140.1 hypothetical protein SmJEL517_g03116 [Synchytrium microbalum]
MLQTGRLLKVVKPARIKGPFQRFATTDATNAKKKGFPIIRYTFTLTLLAAGAYGGAGYYALHANDNGSFQKQFVDNVPGASLAIDAVKKLETTSIDEIKDTTGKAVENVEKAVRDVREGSGKAIETVTKTYENAAKSVGEMSESAGKTIESVTRSAQSAKDNVVKQVTSIQHTVEGWTETVQDQYETAKAMVTGQPKPVKVEKTVPVTTTTDKDGDSWKPGSAPKPRDPIPATAVAPVVKPVEKKDAVEKPSVEQAIPAVVKAVGEAATQVKEDVEKVVAPIVKKETKSSTITESSVVVAKKDEVKPVKPVKVDDIPVKVEAATKEPSKVLLDVVDTVPAVVNAAIPVVEAIKEDVKDVVKEAVTVAKEVIPSVVTPPGPNLPPVVDETIKKVEETVTKVEESAKKVVAAPKPSSDGFLSTEELKALKSGKTPSDEKEESKKKEVVEKPSAPAIPATPTPKPVPATAPSNPPSTTPKSFKDIEDALKTIPEQPIVKSLTRVVNILSSSLNSSPTVVNDVRDELHAIAEYVKSLSIAEAAKLKHQLEEHADKYSEILSEHVVAAETALIEQAASFKQATDEKVKEALSRIELEHAEKLQRALSAQNAEFKATMVKELAAQAEDLERYYSQEVKTRVDKERAGRLARLDHLALKLHHLERIALNAGEGLERQYNATAFRAAVDVLRDTALGAAIRTGFATEAAAIQNLGRGRAFVETLLESIPNDICKTGVATLPYLEDRFYHVKDAVRRVQLVPDDAGPISYMLSVGLSYFILAKEGLVPGNDVEAIVARAEHWMREGDLDSATRELNSLRGWPKRLAKDWLKEARQRLEVEQVVDILDAHTRLQGLGQL